MGDARLTRLPPGLRPWGPELLKLGVAARRVLGPWLPRIARCLQLDGRAVADPLGEVDGYDGIAWRGPIERLVLTEWALAEVAPDEFIRRAAMREQAFLRIHRAEPCRSDRLVVIFDLGPASAGAPRLGFLALLVLAAARARAADRELRWSLADDPRPHPSIEGPALRCFARPAPRENATPRQVLAVLDATGALAGPVELWWVSVAGPGPELPRDLDARRFEVTVPIRLPPDTLSIRDDRREVGLELPPTDQLLGILRDPASRQGPKVSVSAPRPGVTSLVMCQRPHTVIRAGTEGFWIHALRQDDQHDAHAPRFRSVPDAVAVGALSRKMSFALFRSGSEQFRIRIFGAKGGWYDSGDLVFPEPPVLPGADAPPFSLIRFGARSNEFALLDEVGQLFVLRRRPNRDDPPADAERVTDREVVAWGLQHGHLWWAAVIPDGPTVEITSPRLFTRRHPTERGLRGLPVRRAGFATAAAFLGVYPSGRMELFWMNRVIPLPGTLDAAGELIGAVLGPTRPRTERPELSLLRLVGGRTLVVMNDEGQSVAGAELPQPVFRVSMPPCRSPVAVAELADGRFWGFELPSLRPMSFGPRP